MTKKLKIIKRDIAGALICSNDGKYLLGKAQSGAVFTRKWCILGGGIKEGESKEKAIIREVAEESRLDISEAILDLICDSRTGISQKRLKTGEEVMAKMRFFDFKVTLNQTSKDIILEPDKREWSDMRWFTSEEITRLELSLPTKLLLEELKIV
jgi:8-oxo-dGTP pyrophosphatase MutT (NUDIX family)